MPTRSRMTGWNRLAAGMGEISPDDLRRERRDQRLNLRISRSERATIEGVARSLEMSVSEFVIEASVLAAKRLSERGGRKRKR